MSVAAADVAIGDLTPGYEYAAKLRDEIKQLRRELSALAAAYLAPHQQNAAMEESEPW